MLAILTRELHNLNFQYKSASTVLSVGGLRQQFSLEENIQMSLFGADFIRNVKEYLGEDVELNFTPHGYLLLASEQGADQLIKNSALQNTLGAKNELLTAEKLKSRFPWLNTKDISIGKINIMINVHYYIKHEIFRMSWFRKRRMV